MARVLAGCAAAGRVSAALAMMASVAARRLRAGTEEVMSEGHVLETL